MLVLFSFKTYEDEIVSIGLISLISITKPDQSLFSVFKFTGESGLRAQFAGGFSQKKELYSLD